jgi:transposase
MRLFVGDDWAEGHHDVELMNEQGRVLARDLLPEEAAGMARLHELIGQQLGEDADDAEVIIGTEAGRGLWVAALAAAGYTVYGVNPLCGWRSRAPSTWRISGTAGRRTARLPGRAGRWPRCWASRPRWCLDLPWRGTG